ncbi:N-acetylmuramoyl-L-alanine amidase family protein [Alloiococcus sp. CFN-8]|uniref:N-acetylmuramoyl-L-alanine amidase family protein n=1 Tax=Alloiococcus sp. CFN-8 TaxID=3416081 RepID=UPI003CF5B8A3
MRIKKKAKRKILKLLTMIFFLSGTLAIISTLFSKEFVNGSSELLIISSAKLKSKDFKKDITIEENSYFEKYTIKLAEEAGDIDGQTFSTGYRVIVYGKLKDTSLKEGIHYGFNEDVDISTNGKKLTVVIPTSYKDNFVYLNPLDSRELIILAAKRDNPYDHTVTLDPGHGGADVGANYGDLYEKNVNLKIALYMKMGLIYEGKRVIMTREDDHVLLNDVQWLDAITKTANASKSDAFVSIHINSFDKSEEPNGLSTYYYTKGHESQAKDRILLAETIQKHIITSDGWKDMGVKEESFEVIRDTTMPSVLVECGFMSNPGDRRRLSDDNTLMNLAENINKGIIEYLEANN